MAKYVDVEPLIEEYTKSINYVTTHATKMNIMEFAAFRAVIAQYAAVELIDLLTACCLMKSVNGLGYNGSQLALLFKLCKLDVSGIWLCVKAEHFCSVEAIEFFGLFNEKGVTENSFRRIVPLLTVETVNASKVRDAALGGNSSTTEKHDIMRAFYNFG